MLNNWWYLQSGVEKKIDFQKLLGGNHILNIEVYKSPSTSVQNFTSVDD